MVLTEMSSEKRVHRRKGRFDQYLPSPLRQLAQDLSLNHTNQHHHKSTVFTQEFE